MLVLVGRQDCKVMRNLAFKNIFLNHIIILCDILSEVIMCVVVTRKLSGIIFPIKESSVTVPMNNQCLHGIYLVTRSGG
jgi:hypothetical protein